MNKIIGGGHLHNLYKYTKSKEIYFSMIVTILIWGYAAILSFIYGLISNDLLDKLLKREVVLPLPLTMINGLLLMTWMFSFWQLFFRIHIVVHVLILGISILYIIRSRTTISVIIKIRNINIKNFWLPISLFFLQMVLILILTISPIVHMDTGIYHATTIRWFEKFPIIPGLGNLFHNLAFNNSWFVISAFFSLSFLQTQPFYGLNGFITLLFTGLCLYYIYSNKNKTNNLFRIFASLLVFLPPVIMSYAYPSLSPDVPAFILVWIIFLLFLQKLTCTEPYQLDTNTLLIFFYSIFAITIKVSSLPIFLIPLFLVIQMIKKESFLRLLIILLMGFLFLLPWVIRSYYLSGYVLFPFHWIDVFSPDWKIPLEQVILQEQWIQNYHLNRYHINYQQILNLHLDEWLPFWASHTSPWKPFGFFAGILFPSVIIVMLGTFTYDIINKVKPILSWTYFVIICGCLFWFFSAPTPRFGEGFLMPLLTLPLAHLFSIISRNRSELFRWSMVVPFIIILVIYFESLIPINFNVVNRKTILQLAGYPEPVLQYRYIDGQKIYFAKDSLCWDAPVPCAFNSNFNFKMRGETILEGFRYAESQD